MRFALIPFIEDSQRRLERSHLCVGGDYVYMYVNKCIMSCIVNSIPLRRIWKIRKGMHCLAWNVL